MPERLLGKTGVSVPIFSLGGQGALETHGDRGNCIRIIERAIELGAKYMDTSPIYGPSESIYGEVLPSIRDKIFLATKSDMRDYNGAMKDIKNSLKRLKTDYIDLWQIHHLDSIDEVDEVTSKNGALRAFVEMQRAGVVKHLGITGHQDPMVLIEIMRRHDFDVVLCPVNACDRAMKPSFIDTVVKEANRRSMGIIGMKVFAQGYIFHPHGINTVWEALNYAWSQPITTVIIGCDNVGQLEMNVDLARRFKRLSDDELKNVEKKAEPHKRRGCFFRKEFGGYDSKDVLGPVYAAKSD